MKLIYAILYAVGLLLVAIGVVAITDILHHLFGLWFDIPGALAVFIIAVLVIAASDSEDKEKTK